MTGSPTPDRGDETHERLVLPLVVPAILFLFSVLVVYGLSRIYLDLDTWHYKDVGMATPLAIGIALLILLVSTYMAGKAVPRWQAGLIILLAAGGLTGGAVWAAVHPDTKPHEVIATSTPGGPTPGPGEIAVTLHDGPFELIANPETAIPGPVTFNVTNTGSTIHNIRVIKTDLAPEDLPIDDSGFRVDETAVDVVESGDDLNPEASELVTADLEAASYVLICNIASHYQSGMRAAFTVQ
jgi:uncharacterized cupredoxin-like copper-binding protein